MALPSPHAVLARPGVVGDERRQHRFRALDEPGEAAIVYARATISDVLEQTRHGVGERCSAACDKEFADLGDRAALFGRGKQLARLELPHHVRSAHSVGVEG
jgi:hypothetical protein